VPIRYGRLDLFKFILPPFFRRDPIAHLKTQLGLVARAHKGARISVVAHSFGTYAIARILDEDTALHIHRLVLCGSIIPPRFEWHRIAGKVDEQIINECATRDILPVLATTSSWGYGDSGTYGFDSTLVLDRFHALDHSGFQSKDFYSRWWLPLWKQPPSLQVPDTGNRPVSPWWFRVVELVPVKSLVFVAIVVLALRCSR
jgi:pimeloyl-ACP methyl ester carboxylesterase